MEAVFRANRVTDTGRQYRKIHKLNTTLNNRQCRTQHNKTTLVQLPRMTLGQEMTWAYFTALPSPHEVPQCPSKHTYSDNCSKLYHAE